MKKVMLIGDSHTKITFPMISDLLMDNGYDVVDAVSNIGWATYSYNRDPTDLEYGLSQNPDIIIVSLGGNNHYLSDAKYKERVDEFLNLIEANNRRVVWISPFYATDEGVQKRHLWTHNWLRDNLPSKIKYIDIMQYTPKIGSDGVHYPKSSYTQIVDSISNELLQSVKSSVLTKLLIAGVVAGIFFLRGKK
tara:strand:+ start:536 stop:1111 length:576 start_codon:yes stop_codon:yes gene_type:complete